MGRKTVADLEAENAKLKEELANGVDTSALEAENTALVDQVELLKDAKAQAEARLVQAIDDMEPPVIIDGKVQAEGCKVFYGNEYTEDLLKRNINIVSKFDIETLRTFINSDWSPKMVMEKFGLSEAQLQSYVWKLSEQELRGDKPIKLDLRRDVFGREG